MQAIRAVSLEKPLINLEARRYKDELEVYKSIAKIAITAAITLVFICISMAFTIINMNAKYNSLESDYDDLAYSKMEIAISSVDKDNYIKDLTDNIKVLSSGTKEFKSVIDGLDKQNASLLKENKKIAKELDTFKQREELYDKYEYAIYNKAGKRTDLTYDQIKTGDQLMKEKGMDPNVLFGILMAESGGVETASNSTSTARGYGQLLAGTGKFVYENLQGHAKGSYNHSYAYNGDMNIVMMIDLLDYFKNDKDYSLHKTIQSYRGLQDVACYERTINSYISKSGNSLDAIAVKW